MREYTVYSVLGNDHSKSNYTTAVTKQLICKKSPLLGNGSSAQQRNCVLCVVRDITTLHNNGERCFLYAFRAESLRDSV
jgi:hypothetical protein